MCFVKDYIKKMKEAEALGLDDCLIKPEDTKKTMMDGD